MGLQTLNYDTNAVASLIGWWHDAGVDVAVGETPHDWLAAGRAKTAGTTASRSPATAGPQSLEKLIDHLMTGDIADAGPPSRRVLPTGNPSSRLMILTDFPDPADLHSGELLSDAVFTKMLEAIGHSRASVYIASLCPGRPDTGRLADGGLAALTVLAKQHIGFVAPNQLWLVGSAPSRAILGIEDAAAKGKLHSVNHLGTIMEAIATAHPRMFDGSKSRKAAAWTEMQRLIVRTDA